MKHYFSKSIFADKALESLIYDMGFKRPAVMAPSEPVTVKRFDGDMEKLGSLYWLGHHDMERRLDSLKEYLAQAD